MQIADGRDFMEYRQPVDWIVTNPPWSKIPPFLRHGMTLASDIVFLASVSHFMLRARLSAIHEAGFGLREALLLPHPPEWDSSGFQLAAVHIQKRYSGGLVTRRYNGMRIPL